MSDTPELRPWFELFLSLTIGAAVMVGLATVISRRMTSAAWQRTVWQTSTLGLGLLLIGELTGIAGGLIGWSRERLAVSMTANAAPRRAGVVDAVNRDFVLPDAFELETEADSLWSEGGQSAEESLRHTNPTRQRGRESVDFPSSIDARPRWRVGFVWAAWLWFIGTAVLLIRLLVGRLLLEWFRWRHHAAGDAFWHDRAQSMARRLGLRRRVRVMIVRGSSGPISLGTLRPTIGLPEGFTEQFDRPQQEAMLAHELGHLAAHDSAWHSLADLVAAGLWWHPLVWWSRHELRSASEWAADEASLALPDGAESLAACLVEFGRRSVRRQTAGWTGIEGNGFRSSLGRRVERLLRMSDRPWSRPRAVRANLVKVFGPAVMVAVALVSTGWSRPPETSQGETMFQSIRQSWRQSLAALMFLGVAGNSHDATLLAVDDPFSDKVVAKDDTRPDPQSAKDEDEDDDNKKSVKGKKDDDDRRDTKPVKKGDDDDKKSIKGKKGDGDEKEASLDELRARLKQLEAENAKLRNAVQEKQATGSGTYKKAVENKFIEKLPPIKSTKPVDPHLQKGGEKQADEQQQILTKLKSVQEQIAQLQKEGRKEEAEKLTHAAQDLQQMLGERPAKHGKEPQKDPAPFADRIGQLKREIEESARNGQKERVDALRLELEKTADHARQMQRKGFTKPDPKPGQEPPQELGAVIKQLSEEVQRLRAEVNELRSLVKDRGDEPRKLGR